MPNYNNRRYIIQNLETMEFLSILNEDLRKCSYTEIQKDAVVYVGRATAAAVCKHMRKKTGVLHVSVYLK